MQTQDTQASNVVSLFQRREQQAQAASTEGVEASDKKEGESFQEIAERNKKNAERMAKERANANKSVLRSYRIKN